MAWGGRGPHLRPGPTSWEESTVGSPLGKPLLPLGGSSRLILEEDREDPVAPAVKPQRDLDHRLRAAARLA